LKIVILGAMGMLGRALVREFARRSLSVIQVSRNEPMHFDGSKSSVEALVSDFELGEGDFVLNTVGQVKSQIEETNLRSMREALNANTFLPLLLAEEAESRGFRIIAPATDCVFSGKEGNYSEHSHHDPQDVYGKSKSLGEVMSRQVLNIRCSFVGPEANTRKMLMEWVRHLEFNAQVQGYTDHYWNGVTVDTLARLFTGLVESHSTLHGTYHFIPADVVTKHQLLLMLTERLSRGDITVNPSESPSPTNRVLVTEYDETNLALWKLAGYNFPQPVRSLVRDQQIEEAGN